MLGSQRAEERIGVSTHFLPATNGETLWQAIEMVAEAGFAGLELVPSLDQAQIGYPANHPNVGLDLFEATDAQLEQLRQALKAFRWVTVHAPHLDWNLASANRHLRRLTRDYYLRCFELAAELGAIALTFHPGSQTRGYIRPREEIWEHNLAFAAEILPKAQAIGLPVGYETGGLDELKYVADRLPGWGINLDIGHAYMIGGSDAAFRAYLEEFRGRIVEVHHNGVNHYWGGYMEHQPASLNNVIDYQFVYTWLRDAGYDGPIVCELQGNDIRQVLRHCREAKRLIKLLWEGEIALERRWLP